MDLHTIKVVLAITAPFLLLTVWAIVNAGQKDFGSLGKKAIWMMIAAIPFIGAFIYLIFGFRKGQKTSPG